MNTWGAWMKCELWLETVQVLMEQSWFFRWKLQPLKASSVHIYSLKWCLYINLVLRSLGEKQSFYRSEKTCFNVVMLLVWKTSVNSWSSATGRLKVRESGRGGSAAGGGRPSSSPPVCSCDLVHTDLHKTTADDGVSSSGTCNYFRLHVCFHANSSLGWISSAHRDLLPGNRLFTI